MTDYYSELSIERTLSVDEIKKLLNQLESTWVRREATNPEKAVKMRSLIIEARKVFEDVASKSRYDLELEAEKQPIKENAPQDAREASLKSWNDQALTYFNNKEYDLAKTAIERAFSYVNPDVCNDALYSLAADIYYHNNNLQEALNYINKAIVEKRAPMHFILKAVICESLAKRPNNTGGNFTAECYKALDSAIAVAEGNGNKEELGNAYGVYALLLQRNGCSDENRLEEYARKGMQYGDSWDNAGKVLRSIESARAQREARERQKLEEEKQRIYSEAMTLASAEDVANIDKAILLLEKIADYKDSTVQIQRFHDRIQHINKDTKKRKKRKRRAIIIAILIPFILVFAFGIVLCEEKYQLAMDFYEEGDYFLAYRYFSYKGVMPFYRDSYWKMKEMMPYDLGDTIVLGEYEQDGDLANGPEPIEWIIVDHDFSRGYKIISKYCLEGMCYNSTAGEVHFTESSLFEWLNENFYSDAFDESEKSILSAMTDFDDAYVVIGDEYSWSMDYWDYEKKRERPFYHTTATPFAASKVDLCEGYACWWTKRPGDYYGDAYVTMIDTPSTASLNEEGDCIVTFENGGVRPVVYVQYGLIETDE